MKLGARAFKTGVAIMITMYIATLIGFELDSLLEQLRPQRHYSPPSIVPFKRWQSRFKRTF